MRAATSCQAQRAWRLAAIDLDGTLLGPDLTIGAANRRAVAALQAAGIEVALASGRHHASIKPFALGLPGVRWIISAQGGEVSDLTHATVLSQNFLSPECVRSVLPVQRQLGIDAVFYTPDAILTDGPPGEALAFYTGLTGLSTKRVPREELERAAIYKIVWIASAAIIDSLVTDPRVATVPTQQVKTHARLYEFMPTQVNKATGLAALAKHLGVTAAETLAFGDADNDVPMLEWAGGSFAMAHGWPSARQCARWVAPAGPVESAFARAVDCALAARVGPQ